MPIFQYVFLAPPMGAAPVCVPGMPGWPFPAFPNPVSLSWPQLFNAQLRLGVYPPGWVINELTWRVLSLTLACVGPRAPAVPAAPPAVGAAAVLAPFPAFGPANCAPSPVATGIDATEKGQLGYHIGTAVGGTLIPYLAPSGPPLACAWFSFHLSRRCTTSWSGRTKGTVALPARHRSRLRWRRRPRS